MRVDDLDFDLPRALIADHPAVPRDAARLLVVGREGLADRMIGELPKLLRRGDVMVFNDTLVIPARLTGRRGAARIEITLHRRLGGADWLAFAKGARRLHPGDRIAFAADFAADVVAKSPSGEITLRFDRAGAELRAPPDQVRQAKRLAFSGVALSLALQRLTLSAPQIGPSKLPWRHCCRSPLWRAICQCPRQSASQLSRSGLQHPLRHRHRPH